MGESELAKYPVLYLRGGVWYVRKKVPLDLRHVIKKEQVRKSLDVRDKRSALRLYSTKKAEIDNEFETARAQLSRQDSITQALLTARLDRMTTAEIDTLVWQWWEKRAQSRDVVIEDDDLPEVLSVIESDISDLNSRDGNHAADVADQLLVQSGIAAAPRKIGAITTAVRFPTVDRSSAQYKYICHRVGIALEIEAKLVRDRLTGQQSAPADPMFNLANGVSGPVRSGKTHKTLGDLVDAYRTERVLLHGEESTARKFGVLFQLLSDVVGRHKLVADLGREDITAVLSFLKALPPNASKRFPQLTLSEARDHAVTLGLPGLAPNSVATYKQNFAAILNWGQNDGWPITANAKGLVVSRTPQVKRRGFRPPELQGIFTALAPYRETEPTRFWVPALALYTGARAGEICQLRAEDLVRIDGVWCLNLTLFDADGQRVPNKSLKTASSERFVPLHKQLLSAGLLDYHRSVSGQLFPDLEPGRNGRYSEGFSKWFGRFLDRVGYSSKSLVFHSFRHGFRDACRHAEGIREETALALGGWSSENQATDYGDRGAVPVLARAVAKINYGTFALTKVL